MKKLSLILASILILTTIAVGASVSVSAEVTTSGSCGDRGDNVTFVYDIGGNQLFAEDYGFIEIEYMIPTTNAGTSYETQLFLCSGDVSAPVAEAAVTGALIADGQYHTLQIKVKDLAFWNGLLHMIRFDYFSSPEVGDVIYVKTIKLVAN